MLYLCSRNSNTPQIFIKYCSLYHINHPMSTISYIQSKPTAMKTNYICRQKRETEKRIKREERAKNNRRTTEEMLVES